MFYCHTLWKNFLKTLNELRIFCWYEGPAHMYLVIFKNEDLFSPFGVCISRPRANGIKVRVQSFSRALLITGRVRSEPAHAQYVKSSVSESILRIRMDVETRF